MSNYDPLDRLDSAVLAELQALVNSTWVMPADMPTVGESRRELLDAFVDAVVPAIRGIYLTEFQAYKEKAVVQKIQQGIRTAFKTLRSQHFPEVMKMDLWIIPNEWQPPVAETEPENPPDHYLQLYRLTAAFIALSIRYNLKLLHVGGVSGDFLARLDGAILNAVYGVLLTHPGHAWNFNLPARWLILCALMKLEGAGLPPVAGE